jgi:hypothetical protein
VHRSFLAVLLWDCAPLCQAHWRRVVAPLHKKYIIIIPVLELKFILKMTVLSDQKIISGKRKIQNENVNTVFPVYFQIS